ncbi:MAG: hypothetical protein ACOZCF_11725 [Bacillota bacterium]
MGQTEGSRPSQSGPRGDRNPVRNGLLVAFQSNLTIIETFEQQLAEIEKAIIEVAPSPWMGTTNHLISVPGMGPVSKAAILGEIDNIC